MDLVLMEGSDFVIHAFGIHPDSIAVSTTLREQPAVQLCFVCGLKSDIVCIISNPLPVWDFFFFFFCACCSACFPLNWNQGNPYVCHILMYTHPLNIHLFCALRHSLRRKHSRICSDHFFLFVRCTHNHETTEFGSHSLLPRVDHVTPLQRVNGGNARCSRDSARQISLYLPAGLQR